MLFPYREIHDFQDAQGNFEFLAGVLASSFLQLLSRQELYAQAGTVAVSWPGGQGGSTGSPVNFPAPFPTALLALFVSASITSGGSYAFATQSSGSTTGFTAFAGSPFITPAVGVTATVSWLALGN